MPRKILRNVIQKAKNRYHLSQARKASKQFGHPHKELKVIGVTGTDGKTTTISMISHILNESGLKTGFVTSVEARVGNKSVDTGLHVTSPEPWDLPKILRLMVEEEAEFAVVETTSNGLDQNRFGDIKFDAAVITNIREDHLDYHGTWERYASAKFRLLQSLKDEGVAILNGDDSESAEWLRRKSEDIKQTIYVKWAEKRFVTYFNADFGMMEFKYNDLHFSIPVLGTIYNLENVLQAIMLCEAILPLGKIRDALSTFKLPSGRMEVMLVDPIKIVVDFAHTPASLEQALGSIKSILPKGRRLITVFGCAGKRDKGRRRMGKVSAHYSDLTILTAEDPRSEKLKNVNTEIFNTAKKDHAVMIQRFNNHDDYALTGLGEIHALSETAWKQGHEPFIAFDEDAKTSRRDAIELAIRLARRGDCVFITGKGHEKSLAFGREEKEFAWSDQDEVRAALKRLKITN